MVTPEIKTKKEKENCECVCAVQLLKHSVSARRGSQCSTYRTQSSFVAGATALRRAIMMMICRILFSMSAGWHSGEQVKLHMHLAHSSYISYYREEEGGGVGVRREVMR
jgi:hypothetical protein